MAFLAADNIGMRFDAFEALKGVTLQAERGEFVTLLGPSGCGKTTLLNIIAGFLTPTRGRLTVDGRDVTHTPPERRDSAMCFQSYALFPHLTVRDNVAFGPRQRRVSADETDRRVDALIQQIGLAAHQDKRPNALSGGQQQRVALARALAVAPGLVLFDEPLSNLDAKLRDQVRTEIRSLQQKVGFTAIYVTHDQAEALAMSDRILLLNNGVIEQEGAPRDIYFSPRTRFVADFIGAANLHSGIARGGVLDTPFGALRPATLPADGPVTLCWRPEMARVGLAGDANNLRGQIASLAFQGAYTDVFVTAGGETLRLQLPGAFGAEPGDPVAFSVAPDAITGVRDAA
ncbi:ABC transporter ATP-binding protein [Paracoccus sp. (in: a-proteobacteria)]|uniref:ABC transporter ATP-binding protein n=1 Tax=Paracoccus sp. TaxID=267 RepID=UPI0026E04D28|nr:ABC transporter ATP-binding protein [Paracoccus sp. (in: a-proteobacteria)]MDO5647531.1 ABC transporter ATP-binding protein [Paracoccus sp. (in: a-proteobacteria)]